jgi:hypothetical protein
MQGNNQVQVPRQGYKRHLASGQELVTRGKHTHRSQVRIPCAAPQPLKTPPNPPQNPTAQAQALNPRTSNPPSRPAEPKRAHGTHWTLRSERVIQGGPGAPDPVATGRSGAEQRESTNREGRVRGGSTALIASEPREVSWRSGEAGGCSARSGSERGRPQRRGGAAPRGRRSGVRWG